MLHSGYWLPGDQWELKVLLCPVLSLNRKLNDIPFSARVERQVEGGQPFPHFSEDSFLEISLQFLALVAFGKGKKKS